MIRHSKSVQICQVNDKINRPRAQNSCALLTFVKSKFFCQYKNGKITRYMVAAGYGDVDSTNGEVKYLLLF